MSKRTLVSLTICLVLVIVLVISAATLADIASETKTKAEQRFERANELLKRMDYEAAISEYNKVISLSSNSKIAQNAQYWIGQSHFRAGQFDAAQATFVKLIEQYPASAIVPVTKLMVERVGQAKKNEEKRKAMSNTADKGFIIDPDTGVKYSKTVSFAGKNDVIVIKYKTDLNLSPNGKFLLRERLVVPVDGSDPFVLVDTPAYRGIWSPDGKKVAFYSEDAICVVPVSPETGRPTGPVRKLLDGKYKSLPKVGWSPDGEKIAFTRHGDIWTLSIKDGSLIQITSDSNTVEYRPAWSPDGKWIAYAKGLRSLFLSPAEGGTPRKIAEPVERCFPSWSPDGKWILCRTGGKIHIFGLDDNQKLEIIPPREVGGFFFSWSPDGKKMLFYRPSYDYKYDLKVVSSSGGPPLALGKQFSLYGGVWSPDSKSIAVQGENEDGDIVIWIIPFSGDDPVLLEMDVSVDGKPFPLGVSPDVKKLKFSVRSDDGTEDLFVVPISLKDARTTGPAVKVFDGWSRRGSYNTTTSFSPDGNKLAVIYRKDVWIASANGDKPIQITKTPEKKSWPRWSSDGKMVHYIVRSGQYLRPLYVVPASGGKVTKILDNCRDYAWSPDRKELAVALNDLISIIPLQGGGTRQIARFKDLDLEDVHTLSWSPDGRYIACLGNHIVKGYSGPIFVIPVEGGRPTTLVTEDDGFKWGPSWSPDSKWIAYTSEGSVKMRPEGTMWEADFEEILKKASR